MTEIDRVKILKKMEQQGGHFERALAKAWLHADLENHRRLKEAFPHLWERYKKRVYGD